MSRRPPGNRRRGIIRAALVIIGLLILLIAAMLVVSSLTSPTANAPAPSTPARLQPPGTPSTIKLKGTPAARPTAKPQATQHKDVAAAPPSGRLLGLAPLGAGTKNVSPGIQSPARAPSGTGLVFFSSAATPYHNAPLLYRPAAAAPNVRIGQGDALVRPVWSPTSSSVLYVRARPVAGIPATQWTLLQTRVAPLRTVTLARVRAMSVVPLGWRHGLPVYLVANATNTSLYQAGRSGASLVGIVAPQPIVTAQLSPDGTRVAAAVPTNCTWCTLDTYTIRTDKLWSGPTGLPNEYDYAWSPDGHRLAALVGKRIVVFSPQSANQRSFPVPVNLPRRWRDLFSLNLQSGAVVLRDTVTGARYISRGGPAILT